MELDSPLGEAKLRQTIELPAPCEPIQLVRYLPSATMEQEVVPEDGGRGRPAIELFISGPTQSYKRWLIADDPDRNRLVSFIGTWRYMAVADRGQRDELLKQFETELTRGPRITVSRPGIEGVHEFDLSVGTVQRIGDLDCTVRVLDFYPHYAMDRETMTPTNRSDRRQNPAVHIEIEHRDVTERRWVFSKFPDFTADPTSGLPFRVTLDCPGESTRAVPDFALVTVSGKKTEAWTRNDGKTSTSPLRVKESVPIPGSRYVFSITAFVSAGRMVERFVRAEPGKGVPVILIRVPGEAETQTELWLESGKPRTVLTPHGVLTVSFGARPSQPTGAHP